jgi:predicted nucleic acid-binding protein
MKVAFDTSLLVAALVEEHPVHERALWWLDPEREFARVACWHAYAESWAVLTSIPLDPPVSGQVAATVLDRVRSVIAFVPPRAGTYREAVARCAGIGLRSGAIYDAIHLLTAEAEKADIFLTFNEGDFTRLSIPGGPRIVVPPDPPRIP